MIPYIEAPNYLKTSDFENKAIFLGGSITGAYDWQARAAQRLVEAGFQVFNPRRRGYDKLIEGIEDEQIEWEYLHLEATLIHLYWFSHETLAPITLFELGCYLHSTLHDKKKLYVGTHPNYQRKNDVRIQIGLRTRGNVPIFDNLDAMIDKIIQENA